MKVGIKSAFNKKRIFIAVLVLVILAVMVISNPEIRDFFSHSDAVKLNFQTGIEYDMTKTFFLPITRVYMPLTNLAAKPGMLFRQLHRPTRR